jgi:carbamoyl-phosphate synthase large subunit
MIIQVRQAMSRLAGLDTAKVIVASSEPLTPAGCFADAAVQVPLIKDDDYIGRLLEVCQEHDVGVILPLIDLDLERLAPHVDTFARVGTTVVCPSAPMVELCLDKVRFAQFCHDNMLEHLPYHAISHLEPLSFPVFFKRRRGFGSIGSGICRSLDEAQALVRRDSSVVFQALVDAPEVSVDAYISHSGACVVCVPRSRDKVVAGEAYKTRTIPSGPSAELARRTIARLTDAGLRGPLNVQIFDTNPACLIEVNTRLGSGSVLSNVAVGGRLLEAVLEEAFGSVADGNADDYAVGLHLTRFLGDVFHTDSAVVSILPHESW